MTTSSGKWCRLVLSSSPCPRPWSASSSDRTPVGHHIFLLLVPPLPLRLERFYAHQFATGGLLQDICALSSASLLVRLTDSSTLTRIVARSFHHSLQHVLWWCAQSSDGPSISCLRLRCQVVTSGGWRFEVACWMEIWKCRVEI